MITVNKLYRGLTGFPHYGFLLQLLFFISALLLLTLNPEDPDIKSFSLFFSSIMLEAIPFMVFGSLVGGIIEVFVSHEKMAAILPEKRPWLAVLAAAGAGCVLPVCECAVVPVVRRLVKKGLPAGAAIAYLLGGPIVNPIVLFSTALAYNYDSPIIFLRLGLGYMIAVSVGLFMGWYLKSADSKKNGLILEGPVACGCSHEPVSSPTPVIQPIQNPHSVFLPMHSDLKNDSDCGCGHDHSGESLRGKLISALRHSADDFWTVGHYLVIGAFIAALAQTYIDRGVFLNIAGYFGVSTILMMSLAILLNLCSEADAFIAASFRGLIHMPGQLAFLLTGPMFDLKLLLMYQSLFKKRTIAVLAVSILTTVLVVVLAVELITGGASI